MTMAWAPDMQMKMALARCPFSLLDLQKWTASRASSTSMGAISMVLFVRCGRDERGFSSLLGSVIPLG